MRHYILASHGHFAQGIYESVKIILGEQNNVHIICGYVDGNTDVKELIDEVMHQIPKEDTIIACSDLLGGSVNNELMKYMQRGQFFLITGMNLPLLMNLFLYQQEDPDTLIRRILEEVQGSISYCNQNVEEEKEEDF